MAVAFGRGGGFGSERLLGQLDHGWNLTIGRRSQFLFVLGHEAHPKTTLYGVVFQKIEWAPAYGSAAAYPGELAGGINIDLVIVGQSPSPLWQRPRGRGLLLRHGESSWDKSLKIYGCRVATFSLSLGIL